MMRFKSIMKKISKLSTSLFFLFFCSCGQKVKQTYSISPFLSEATIRKAKRSPELQEKEAQRFFEESFKFNNLSHFFNESEIHPSPDIAIRVSITPDSDPEEVITLLRYNDIWKVLFQKASTNIDSLFFNIYFGYKPIKAVDDEFIINYCCEASLNVSSSFEHGLIEFPNSTDIEGRVHLLHGTSYKIDVFTRETNHSLEFLELYSDSAYYYDNLLKEIILQLQSIKKTCKKNYDCSTFFE